MSWCWWANRIVNHIPAAFIKPFGVTGCAVRQGIQLIIISILDYIPLDELLNKK